MILPISKCFIFNNVVWFSVNQVEQDGRDHFRRNVRGVRCVRFDSRKVVLCILLLTLLSGAPPRLRKRVRHRKYDYVDQSVKTP